MRQRTLYTHAGPFVAAGAAAFVIAVLPPFHPDWTMLAASLAVFAATAIVAALVPWRRVPAALHVLPLLAFFASIGLLREADGGAFAPYAPLVLLPTLWVALYNGRKSVVVVLAGAAAVFFVPLIAVGGEHYPAAEWKRGALVVVVLSMTAFAVRRLIRIIRRREGALIDAEARFRSAFDFVPVGMAIFAPDGRYLQVNDAFCRLTGYSREQLLGMTFLALTHPDDRKSNIALEGDLRSGAVPFATFEKRYLHADGHSVWVSVSASLVRDGDGNVLYGVSQVQDISDRVVLLDRLNTMARTDDLTGLPNRRAWFEELQAEIARVRRLGHPLCVAMFDLDHFKQFNDEHGHQRGDELLKQAAVFWRRSCRETDVLARYGGDEFILSLPACQLGDAERLADRLRRAMPSAQTLSVGIAQWNGSESAEALIARADAALYDAKGAGRDRIAIAA